MENPRFSARLSTTSLGMKSIAMRGPVLDQEWKRLMELHYNAKPVEHKNLLDTLEDLSAKLGVETPRLFITDAFDPSFGYTAPNMAMTWWDNGGKTQHGIVMTKSYLDLFKFDPASKDIAPEIKAVFAHELGHVQQGGAYIDAARRFPLIAGPIAALAGLYLYDKARRKGTGDMPRAIREETQIAKAAIDERHCQACKFLSPEGQALSAQMAEQQKSVLTTGDYLLAGGVGLAAGAMVTRQRMIALEYDADRTSVLLTKDPDAMIRALETFDNYFKNMPPKELEKFEAALEEDATLFKQLVILTLDAHPPTAARILNINKVAKSMKYGLERVGSHIPPL